MEVNGQVLLLPPAMKKKKDEWLYFIGNEGGYCAANDSHIVSIDVSGGEYNPSLEIYQRLLTLKRRSFSYPH